MIYAIIRGWLAGMAVLLIEILLGAILFTPGFPSPPLSTAFAFSISSIICIALLEEGLKFLALRGISSETVPFFRNAIFKGFLIGFGFALFEVCIKILFSSDTSNGNPLILGAFSSSLLHIATGGMLGAAWFSRVKRKPLYIFFSWFFLAFVTHVFYNAFLAPILFNRFS